MADNSSGGNHAVENVSEEIPVRNTLEVAKEPQVELNPSLREIFERVEPLIGDFESTLNPEEVADFDKFYKSMNTANLNAYLQRAGNNVAYAIYEAYLDSSRLAEAKRLKDAEHAKERDLDKLVTQKALGNRQFSNEIAANRVNHWKRIKTNAKSHTATAWDETAVPRNSGIDVFKNKVFGFFKNFRFGRR